MQPLLRKAERCLSSAGVELLLKEPFFAHVLSGLARCFSDELDTLGTCFRGNCFCLIINPTFFVHKISDEKRIALIKHELLHLIFGHHLRRPAESCWQESYDIAADLAVNQLVHPWSLPEDAWTLGDFPGLGLQGDKTAEWYHERLKKPVSHDFQTQSSRRGKTGPPPPSTSGEQQKAENNPTQDERKGDSCKNQKKFLHKRVAHSRGSHARWDEKTEHHPDTETEENGKSTRQAHFLLQQAKFQKVIKEAKRKVSKKQWGELPEGLRIEIDSVLAEQSGLPWRRLLRIFAMTSQQTRLVSTHLRESRRFPGEAGNKIRPLGRKLVVAVDTSGSVSEDILRAFFREIQAIQRQRTQVTLVQCDAEIQKISVLRKGEIPELLGGGGTCFDPVFLWLKKNKQQRLGGCIYLTDGHGPAPKIVPECRVLWVITPEGMIGSHLRPGKAIQMK